MRRIRSQAGRIYLELEVVVPPQLQPARCSPASVASSPTLFQAGAR